MRSRFGLVAFLLAMSSVGCADIMGMKQSAERNRTTGPETGTDTNTGTGTSTLGTTTGTDTDADAGTGTGPGTGTGTGIATTGTGLGTGTATMTRVTPDKGFTIAWMSNGTTSSFFNSSRNGAIAAGQQITLRDQVSVNVSIMDPTENKAASQVTRIEEAIANPNVLGLAVDVIDPAIINPEIDKAVESGVTVMTFDSDAPASKRGSYYGMDNRATGVTAAKILTSLMGPAGGEIAIMNKENPPTAANFVARREGFISELANHPGFKVTVDLPCTDGPEGESTLKAGCAGVLEETMAKYPNVTGWFLSRGRPLRQADMGKDAPNWTAKVKAGTFFAVVYDATQETIPNIKAGYVNAVINQKYYGWGYDVVGLLYDVIAKKRSILPFTDSGFDVVCANNVDEVAAAWSKGDFSKPLTKCQLGNSQWP